MPDSSSMMSTEPACADSIGDVLCGTATTALVLCIHGLSDQRKFDVEGGAFARIALHVDLAGVLLDDPVRHREPQAGATRRSVARHVLCGEERIVDSVYMLRRNAGAGVTHGDVNTVAVRGGNGERSAAGHRVLRVQEQVQEHLLQLSGVAVNERQLV